MERKGGREEKVWGEIEERRGRKRGKGITFLIIVKVFQINSVK